MNTATHFPNLYVLAGGRSSRFGSDKAVADMDGIPLLQDVINRLKHDEQRVVLVTGEIKKFESLGYPVVTDQPSGIGPIGGLAAALSHRQEQYGTGWISLISCDLVYPDRQWLDQLSKAIVSTQKTAIAFRSERWEPMIALYHTDMLPQIKHQIRNRRYSIQRLLDLIGAHPAKLPSGLRSIPQANTPEQLEALKTRGVV